MVVNEKCDVYSFSLVVLETIMGRHPGELISSLASSSTQHIMLKDVLDPRLSPHINQTIACGSSYNASIGRPTIQSQITPHNETSITGVFCSKVTIAQALC